MQHVHHHLRNALHRRRHGQTRGHAASQLGQGRCRLVGGALQELPVILPHTSHWPAALQPAWPPNPGAEPMGAKLSRQTRCRTQTPNSAAKLGAELRIQAQACRIQLEARLEALLEAQTHRNSLQPLVQSLVCEFKEC